MKLPQRHRLGRPSHQFAWWHGYFAGKASVHLHNAVSSSGHMKSVFLKSARDYGRHARREYRSWQKAVTNGEMT